MSYKKTDKETSLFNFYATMTYLLIGLVNMPAQTALSFIGVPESNRWWDKMEHFIFYYAWFGECNKFPYIVPVFNLDRHMKDYFHVYYDDGSYVDNKSFFKCVEYFPLFLTANFIDPLQKAKSEDRKLELAGVLMRHIAKTFFPEQNQLIKYFDEALKRIDISNDVNRIVDLDGYSVKELKAEGWI